MFLYLHLIKYENKLLYGSIVRIHHEGFIKHNSMIHIDICDIYNIHYCHDT